MMRKIMRFPSWNGARERPSARTSEEAQHFDAAGGQVDVRLDGQAAHAAEILVECLEVRRELAAGDLPRRPPQCVAGDADVVGARLVAAQEARPAL
jgi:hypothetical protein